MRSITASQSFQKIKNRQKQTHRFDLLCVRFGWKKFQRTVTRPIVYVSPELGGKGSNDITFSRPSSSSSMRLVAPVAVPSPSPPARSIAPGTTAVTAPPCCKTEPEMMPIMPLEPPPYTSGRPSDASARPRAVGNESGDKEGEIEKGRMRCQAVSRD